MNFTMHKMHAQLSRAVKYFAVDVYYYLYINFISPRTLAKVAIKSKNETKTLKILIYSLCSIHCNCIVLNSTIVTYNYSQHFYDL